MKIIMSCIIWVYFTIPFHLPCWLANYNSLLYSFKGCFRVYCIYLYFITAYLQVKVIYSTTTLNDIFPLLSSQPLSVVTRFASTYVITPTTALSSWLHILVARDFNRCLLRFIRRFLVFCSGRVFQNIYCHFAETGSPLVVFPWWTALRERWIPEYLIYECTRISISASNPISQLFTLRS